MRTAQQDGGAAVLDETVDDSSSQTNVILSFSGAFTEASGALVDGNYQLTINGDQITAGGSALDVDGDGSPGGLLIFGNHESDALYRLFADSDQNRVVNIRDLLGIRQTYLLMTGDASFDETLDSNLDGLINIIDLLKLRQNWHKELPFDGASKLWLKITTGKGKLSTNRLKTGRR